MLSWPERCCCDWSQVPGLAVAFVRLTGHRQQTAAATASAAVAMWTLNGRHDCWSAAAAANGDAAAADGADDAGGGGGADAWAT